MCVADAALTAHVAHRHRYHHHRPRCHFTSPSSSPSPIATVITTNTSHASVRRRPAAVAMNPELLMQILSFLWATFETGLRGFLLGFGLTICKECLMRDLRDQGDRDKDAKHSQQARYSETFRKAKIVGIGVGSFILGASIAVPGRWRQGFMQVGTHRLQVSVRYTRTAGSEVFCLRLTSSAGAALRSSAEGPRPGRPSSDRPPCCDYPDPGDRPASQL